MLQGEELSFKAQLRISNLQENLRQRCSFGIGGLFRHTTGNFAKPSFPAKRKKKYVRSVQKLSDFFVLSTQHNEFCKLYSISFKVFPLAVHTLFPALLPLLKTSLKLLLRNDPKLLSRFFHNAFS